MSGSRKRKDGSKWGERVIRDGRIRWWRRTFVPAEEAAYPLSPDFVPREYDGSLDGLTATFYEYSLSEHFPALRDTVWLHSFGDEWPGPNCDERGFFHWERWVLAAPTPLEQTA